MDTLISVLKDPTWQAFVFSPLASALLSLLLSPPSSKVRSNVSAHTVVNSFNNFNSHNVTNYYYQANQSADTVEGFVWLGMLGAPIAYIGIGLQVLHCLDLFAAFLLAFSIVQVARACISQTVALSMLVAPAVAGLAFPLINQARVVAIGYQGIRFAPNVLNSTGLYIFLQAFGILLLAASLWLSALGLTHLAAVAGGDQPGLREWIARATRRYGRGINFVLALLLLAAAEFFIDGNVYSWIR